MKVLVVIPLYNHADTVRRVAEECLALGHEVLVVDDGSSDGGAATLAGLPVRLLTHSGNRGKGAAIMTAAAAAQRLGFSHIVTIDADGQHAASDIARFLPLLQQEPMAIVVGTRDFTVANVPGASKFGRNFSNFWLRLQTGQILGDTQSGFRAYPVAVLLGLPLSQTRYAFEVEVLVRAAWAGVPLRAVDISVYYPPAAERVSHFRGFMDNFRLTLLNTHLTLRSILPWPHRKLVVEAKGTTVSLFHPWRSLQGLLTENSTAGQLAAAAAVGVFLGALPIIALHTVAILFAAGYLQLNKVVAIAASQLTMPPVVPALCIEIGYYLRHGRWLTEVSLETLGYQGLERLYEWLLGSLLLGPLLAGVTALVIYAMAAILRRERRVST